MTRNSAKPLPPDSPKHGTKQGYDYYRCRCEDCTEAWRLEIRRRRAIRKVKSWDAPHGTLSGYTNWGCRCQGCTEACSQNWHEVRKLRGEPREYPRRASE